MSTVVSFLARRCFRLPAALLRPSALAFLVAPFAGVALLAAAGPAVAADAWPSKPITLIVPFPPGGNTDALGRLLAEHLQASLKTSIVVDNRPGAGSMIGSAAVARAAPDGQTFLVGSIANVLNQYFYKKPLYDISKDLVPVAQLVNVPNYLAAGPGAPFKTIGELIAYGKAHPDKLSCATTGVGTGPFLSCELFKQMSGLTIVNVPYKGGAAAMQDTMGGSPEIVFANEALPLIESKRLVGLAVTSGKRTPLAPELPAISETYPGYDVTSWYAVFAPPGTPQPIVDRMSAEIAAILKDDAVRKQLKALGATPVGSSPKEFGSLVDAEIKRWGQIIPPLHITID